MNVYPTVLESNSNTNWNCMELKSKSTSRWIFRIRVLQHPGDRKRQTCVTHLTMEAEFVT